MAPGYLQSDCVFQGPSGQRGPEGPAGKPGEDVSVSTQL